MKHLKIYEDFNKDEIDKVLDKINKHGIDSLTWHEKRILEGEDGEFQGTDDLHKVVSILIKNNLIDPDEVNIFDDHITVHNLKGKNLPWFVDNYIEIEVDENNYETILNIELIDHDEDIDVEERGPVIKYLDEVWSKYFVIFINGYEDYEE
jgi:hypothetical protein